MHAQSQPAPHQQPKSTRLEPSPLTMAPPTYLPLEQPPHEPHPPADPRRAPAAFAGGYQQQPPDAFTAAETTSGGGGGPPLAALHHGRHSPHHERYGGAMSTGGRSGTVAASVAHCPCGRLGGNTLTLWRRGGGAAAAEAAVSFPWVAVVGPDWPCLAVTYGLVLGPGVVFLALVATHLHPAVVAVGAVWVCAALAALSLTACSDPGYLRRQSPAELADARRAAEEAGREAQVTVCAYCNVLREARTSHCYECNSCVLELDHHCPWMGKCIGKYNLRYFYGFLASVFSLIIYVVAVTFSWAVMKGSLAAPR